MNSNGKHNKELVVGKANDSIEITETDGAIFVGLPSDAYKSLINKGNEGVPGIVKDFFEWYFSHKHVEKIFVPYTGVGAFYDGLRQQLHPSSFIACEMNSAEYEINKRLYPSLEWINKNPLDLIKSSAFDADLVTCIPPFGIRTRESIILKDIQGNDVELKDEFGNLVIASSCKALKENGIAIFVVSTSSFLSHKSVFRQFPRLGLGVEAVLALPHGAFLPIAAIDTYLIIVRKRLIEKTFVARLSNEDSLNQQIIENLKKGRDGGRLDFGIYIDSTSFIGVEQLWIDELIRQKQKEYGIQPTKVREILAKVIHNSNKYENQFTEEPNSIFIPIIGKHEVLINIYEPFNNPANYVQVVIDPQKSDASFVANFLNSDFGRQILRSYREGTVFERLDWNKIPEIPIFVPNIRFQNKVLELDSRITSEQNILLGFQNEIDAIKRRLWNSPQLVDEINDSINQFSSRFSPTRRIDSIADLENWSETLPFPLSSILRLWVGTETEDYKEKVEHLIHFFEATLEFFSIIYLSAFRMNGNFEMHLDKLMKKLAERNMGFMVPTNGTWKEANEYFSKQTRKLLNGASRDIELCKLMFADSSLCLPRMLSNYDLISILATSIRYRNEWIGHSGVADKKHWQVRHEEILVQLQKLRGIMKDTWERTQLITPINVKSVKNKPVLTYYLLNGSNTLFVKKSQSIAGGSINGQLHLLSKSDETTLPLLPFIEMGPEPPEENHACYFYNRAEKNGLRFISYHFEKVPEKEVDINEHPDLLRLFKK